MSDALGTGTSTLQARATAALLRLSALDQKEQSAAETSAIETARSRAETSLTLLNECLTTSAQLADLSVHVVKLDARRRKEAGDSRRALRVAAAAFLDPDTPLTNRLNGASVQGALKQADDVARALVRALNASVDAERVRLRPSDIDDPVPDVPGNFAVYRRVKDAKAKLDQVVENRAVSELTSLVGQLRDSAAVWGQLRPQLYAAMSELPPEVRGFVEEASMEDGVPWARLTVAIRAWLDEGDHGDTYRVRRW
jgi:hypothetical protein